MKRNIYLAIILSAMLIALVFWDIAFYKNYECTTTLISISNVSYQEAEIQYREIPEKYYDCYGREWKFDAGRILKNRPDEFTIKSNEKISFLPLNSSFEFFSMYYYSRHYFTTELERTNETTTWEEDIYVTNFEDISGTFNIVIQFWDENKTKIENPIVFKTYNVRASDTYLEHIEYPTAKNALFGAVYFTRGAESATPYTECEQLERIKKVPYEINITKYRTDTIPKTIVYNTTGYQKYIQNKCP